MERNKRSLRGVVRDETGSPIPKATVDVFVQGSQGEQPVTTMQTDAGGRFSADLPDGKYVLEVGVPEIGEPTLQVDLSKSGDSPELEIKLAVASS
jgi:5-hydroxyisourate hydrolase-like protein (transthyretin family)